MNIGFLFGFIAILCFSIISPLGIVVYGAGVSPLGVLTFRAFSAGFLVLLILLIKKISLKIERKDILTLLLHCSILASHLILYWQGLKILNQISVVHALYFTFPMWVCLIAVLFLKEKMSKIKWLSLIIGTIGVLFAVKFLPSISFGGINLIGVGLMLLAAFTWAIDFIIGQCLFKKYHYFTILFYDFLFCLIVFSLLQNPLTTITQITVSSTVFIYITIMGIVSTFMAYVLTYSAIKNIRASSMSIINLTQPFLSIIWAFLLLGQESTILQLFGVFLVILSAYLLPKKVQEG